MTKKMSTNAINRWLEGWVSQTHPVEKNDNTILVSEDQIQHLRRNSKVLNVQILRINKFKALLFTSLSNQSISSTVPTA